MHILEKQPGHNLRVQENQIKNRKTTQILDIPRIFYEDKTQLSLVLKNDTKLVLEKQLEHLSEDKHKSILTKIQSQVEQMFLSTVTFVYRAHPIKLPLMVRKKQRMVKTKECMEAVAAISMLTEKRES